MLDDLKDLAFASRHVHLLRLDDDPVAHVRGHRTPPFHAGLRAGPSSMIVPPTSSPAGPSVTSDAPDVIHPTQARILPEDDACAASAP